MAKIYVIEMQEGYNDSSVISATTNKEYAESLVTRLKESNDNQDGDVNIKIMEYEDEQTLPFEVFLGANHNDSYWGYSLEVWKCRENVFFEEEKGLRVFTMAKDLESAFSFAESRFKEHINKKIAFCKALELSVDSEDAVYRAY